MTLLGLRRALRRSVRSALLGLAARLEPPRPDCDCEVQVATLGGPPEAAARAVDDVIALWPHLAGSLRAAPYDPACGRPSPLPEPCSWVLLACKQDEDMDPVRMFLEGYAKGSPEITAISF